MYLSHYGLNEPPFRITPITDWFYGGANRAAILEALIYAVTHGEGIIKVVGEVGTGKTMMCRVLMERLPPHVDTIYLSDPTLSREEIVYAIADELGADLAGQRATTAMRSLQNTLIERHADGRRVVLLIDEAHAMPAQTLEEVRLLSNLETSRHKLLQIVLFGQPELDDTLRMPEIRQLKDRIVHHFTMQPLTEPVIGEYLTFRMRAAGYHGPDIFTPGAVRLIARASQGLTRRVNVLADKALLAAFVANTHGVEPKHVRKAMLDSELEIPKRSLTPAYAGAGMAAVAAILAFVAWQAWFRPPEAPAPLAAPAPPENARTPAPAAPSPPQTPSPPPAPEGAPAGPAPEKPSAAPAGSTSPSASTTPSPEASSPEKLPAAIAPEFAAHKLLGQRIAATRELLDSGAPNLFTIHLFYTTESAPERIEDFLQRAEDIIDISNIYVTASGKRRTRFRVTYGTFEESTAAVDAMKRLPERFRKGFRLQVTTLNQLRLTG
jgi:type II secretory pathway predicted ATPase ExeA